MTAAQVVLLDEDATAVGAMDKLEAHRRSTRHLAFSVLLFADDGRVLLQRRATHKYHFAGRWSNSCCSHPRPGEALLEAAHRRVGEELGIDSGPLEAHGAFWYEAADPASGLVEHEYDVVVVGRAPAPASCDPDPDEVDDVRLWTPDALRDGMAREPELFTPWLAQVLTVGTGAPSAVAAGVPL